MKLRTLKEWNAKGRLIKKGSKAIQFNDDGTALFSKKQTHKVVFVNYGYSCSRERCVLDDELNYFGHDNPDQMDYDLGLCGQI